MNEMTNPPLGTMESARDIIQTIALAMKNGYQPAEILADDSPIVERIWAEATAIREAAAPSVAQKPVALWQFRWTNPAGDANPPADMLKWKEVDPWMATQTLEQRIEELRSFQYKGKPAYEVRALYATPPSPAQGGADEATKWIAVSERLPADDQSVFCAYWPYNNKSNRQSIQLCIFEAPTGNFLTYTDGDEAHPPSHWMPAPDMPKLPELPIDATMTAPQGKEQA